MRSYIAKHTIYAVCFFVFSVLLGGTDLAKGILAGALFGVLSFVIDKVWLSKNIPPATLDDFAKQAKTEAKGSQKKVVKKPGFLAIRLRK